MRPVENPPNPWSSTHVEYLEPPPPARLEVYEEQAGEILAENDSPDVPYRWGLNPYRGCMHACAYCYARRTHQHLGFGAGTDFERRIVVKTNAAERLRAAFMRPSWAGEIVGFSGVTDCYQPLEASYGITRACLQVCAEHRNPVTVITKSALVCRDVALLQQLTAHAWAQVVVSIPFASEETARAVEPWAAPLRRRFETLRTLSDAGIPTGVSLAPVIPGLNDADMPAILARAAESGARFAFMILLRLPAEVRDVWDQRIARISPARAARVERAMVELHGPSRRDARFGARMVGQGPRWHALESMFRIHCQRNGLHVGQVDPPPSGTFVRNPDRGRDGRL